MEAPKKIEPAGLADYLEVITKAAFQSGISRKVIDARGGHGPPRQGFPG
jgi:hypothetical protein